MKRFYGAILTLALALPMSGAFAGSGPGCGIGEMIFKGQSGLFAHTSAATTNGSTFNQWFGISSNSLGCDENHVVTNEYQRKVFVASNLDNLSQEMAQGQGDHLAALASFIGIPKDEQEAFFSLTQEKYAALYPATKVTADDMYAALTDAMRADARFAQYAD